MDSNGEQDKSQHAEQKKNPKTEKIRQELMKSARIFTDPTLSYITDTSRISSVWYESPDELRLAFISDSNFTRADYAHRNLPEKMRTSERMIPVNLSRRKTPNVSWIDLDKVWVILEEDKLRILQPVRKDNGKPLDDGGYILTGKEEVIERDDLVEDLLTAVSGKKTFSEIHKGKVA